MKKWICYDLGGFHICAVYPDNSKKTLEEIISDYPNDFFDKSITLNSEILIQEHEYHFHILIDNKYSMDLLKDRLMICQSGM